MTTQSDDGVFDAVDPEIAPVLTQFPPFDLSAEGLPGTRAMMSAMSASPDPEQLVPGVDREEVNIPGLESDPPVRVLVYRPRDTAAASGGGLVWMHGGGYLMSAADDDDLACRAKVVATGATVVSVDYRLAPETPFPGPLHDCYAALLWTHAHATELGVDPARIAVGGESAGGGLAATLAALARDRDEVAIVFQLLIYPMLDDRVGSSRNTGAGQGRFIWTKENNVAGWRAYLGDAEADVPPLAAPARLESVTGLAPAFIAVGSIDLFAEEDLAYASRLIHDGVSTEMHVYPGGFHGFVMVPEARISQALQRDSNAALARAFEKDGEAS